eukprot:CAMPEP_0113661644 /NCGR_PEP_ID=MMETSP0038_2-20120614/91_1 /TAXON_ID=2898 /ORGANISM="Cryptomonas paramecium" /LENGTH=93 /DNA_ID=CAMNT_0000576363 /DNA_START=26 /DNA_END=307 /DNA_ORIENTATION=+ /assembly_acc=CAM_ASM_000170
MSSTFVSRMQEDAAKRESQKQINELKRTEEGRALLKKHGLEDGAQKKQAPQPLVAEFGLSGVSAPKVVTHDQNKSNDRKEWDREKWCKNSYLF